jgi:hypothetical protein
MNWTALADHCVDAIAVVTVGLMAINGVEPWALSAPVSIALGKRAGGAVKSRYQA